MMGSCSMELGASISMHNKKSQQFSSFSQFTGHSFTVSDQKKQPMQNNMSFAHLSVKAQASICVSKAMRWWDKTLKPNMVEIHSAAEFVNALNSAADRLVIVDFYSPACGGCKSLHPKICQLAESNPDAIFLKVNYEELKPMCHALHIHVLPFFRFYRGADGRVCSFSCTISTIKKFKDALAKHGTERCSLGPAKGLDESELLQLASMGELSIDPPTPALIKEGSTMEELVLGSIGISNPLNLAGNAMLFA